MLVGKPNLKSTTKFVQKLVNVFGDCLGLIEILLEISKPLRESKVFCDGSRKSTRIDCSKSNMDGQMQLYNRMDASTHVLLYNKPRGGDSKAS